MKTSRSVRHVHVVSRTVHVYTRTSRLFRVAIILDKTWTLRLYVDNENMAEKCLSDGLFLAMFVTLWSTFFKTTHLWVLCATNISAPKEQKNAFFGGC